MDGHKDRQQEIKRSQQKAALLSKVATKKPSTLHLKDAPNKKDIKTAMKSASIMSDTELIDLLRQPPKAVPMLRTKTGFQDFFRGLSTAHFHSLVSTAYASIPDPVDREAKVQKRMDLMTGVWDS
jgi:hypothetical protein